MANVVRSGTTMKLLDWEYGANSDYRFDLAMLSAMGHYTQRHDRLLLREYGRRDQNLYRDLQAMKAVVFFREAAWALLQLSSSKIRFDYKKYAAANLAKFCRTARKLNT